MRCEGALWALAGCTLPTPWVTPRGCWLYIHLADAVGLVSHPSEVLRQQREVQREVAGGIVAKCMVDTGVDDVAAGEKRRPRWAAHWLHKVCAWRGGVEALGLERKRW